jgi:hypothetical protein
MLPPTPQPTISIDELPVAVPGSRGAREWETYRREVRRLLAEGHEGRFVLIKDDNVVGIWDTQQQALDQAHQQFLMQDVLIHQILSREPLFQAPWWLNLPCRG